MYDLLRAHDPLHALAIPNTTVSLQSTIGSCTHHQSSIGCRPCACRLECVSTAPHLGHSQLSACCAAASTTLCQPHHQLRKQVVGCTHLAGSNKSGGVRCCSIGCLGVGLCSGSRSCPAMECPCCPRPARCLFFISERNVMISA